MAENITPPRLAPRAKSPCSHWRFFDARNRALSYDSFHRPGAKPTLPDSKASSFSGGRVKELDLEEVLRIAGGVPVPAALDEVTYRALQEPAGDAVDYAHLLGQAFHAPEPM
jgi:hypothetical protein